jgi:hypothetical protein
LICVRVCRRSIACRSRLLHTHSSGPNTPRGNVRQTNSPQRACDHCPTKHRCLRMTPGAQPPPCSDHTAASPWWRPTWSFFCKRWIAQKGPCNPHIHFFARHGGPSQTHSRCSGEPERIAQPQRSLTESHFHRGHTSVTAPLPATLMSNVLVNIDRVVCVRCTAHTHTHTPTQCMSLVLVDVASARSQAAGSRRTTAVLPTRVCFTSIALFLLSTAACPCIVWQGVVDQQLWAPHTICTPTFLTLYPLLSLHAQFLARTASASCVHERRVPSALSTSCAFRSRTHWPRHSASCSALALLPILSRVARVCTLREVDSLSCCTQLFALV